MTACSACAGDYEDPDRTAREADDDEVGDAEEREDGNAHEGWAGFCKRQSRGGADARERKQEAGAEHTRSPE